MATDGRPMTEGPEVVPADPESGAYPPIESSPSDDGGDAYADVGISDHHSQSQENAHAQELKAKIIKQVEYYFSDENLLNDPFLTKHINKHKSGFVPIPLISSFRKMKKLTKDNSLIVEVLKESSQLVVSADGSRVKRLNPLPLEIKDPSSRTVVVENLREDHSDENIRKMFGEVGKLKVVSICDPRDAEDKKGKKVISAKMHVLLEYETVEGAEKAVATMNDEKDWRNGLRVQLLSKRLGYGPGKKAKKGSQSEKSISQVSDTEVAERNNCSKQCADSQGDEGKEHIPIERNGRKGWNPGRRGHRPLGDHGAGPGIGEASKQQPCSVPKMPDGTRGFTMGRGRPLVFIQGVKGKLVNTGNGMD